MAWEGAAEIWRWMSPKEQNGCGIDMQVKGTGRASRIRASNSANSSLDTSVEDGRMKNSASPAPSGPSSVFLSPSVGSSLERDSPIFVGGGGQLGSDEAVTNVAASSSVFQGLASVINVQDALESVFRIPGQACLGCIVPSPSGNENLMRALRAQIGEDTGCKHSALGPRRTPRTPRLQAPAPVAAEAEWVSSVSDDKCDPGCIAACKLERGSVQGHSELAEVQLGSPSNVAESERSPAGAQVEGDDGDWSLSLVESRHVLQDMHSACKLAQAHSAMLPSEIDASNQTRASRAHAVHTYAEDRVASGMNEELQAESLLRSIPSAPSWVLAALMHRSPQTQPHQAANRCIVSSPSSPAPLPSPAQSHQAGSRGRLLLEGNMRGREDGPSERLHVSTEVVQDWNHRSVSFPLSTPLAAKRDRIGPERKVTAQRSSCRDNAAAFVTEGFHERHLLRYVFVALADHAKSARKMLWRMKVRYERRAMGIVLKAWHVTCARKQYCFAESTGDSGNRIAACKHDAGIQTTYVWSEREKDLEEKEKNCQAVIEKERALRKQLLQSCQELRRQLLESRQRETERQTERDALERERDEGREKEREMQRDLQQLREQIAEPKSQQERPCNVDSSAGEGAAVDGGGGALTRILEKRNSLLTSKLNSKESELAAVMSSSQEEIAALRTRGATDRKALNTLRAKMMLDVQERLKLSRENEKLRMEIAALQGGDKENEMPCRDSM